MANQFGTIQRESIYKHTHLKPQVAERVRPLMESAFADLKESYNGREAIYNERMKFASEQYANRVRVANNMGVNPLYEDSKIFGEAFPNMKQLFESVSTPGNIIGLGEVRNPGNGTDYVPGGMWNPGYKPGSGDIPSYVFGLQSQIALHCIGFDLMPTISVDTPKVVVSYVDTVYGGGTFDDAENMPSFIEVSSSLFKRTWIETKALKRAKTHFLVSDGTNAIEFLFILGSTIKAAITAEVLGTGTYNSTTKAYTVKNEVSVKAIVDAINKAKSGTVMVGTEANGTITWGAAEAITSVGVDYASALRTNIAEAASNDNSLGGMSRAQHEKGPKHKLNVIMMDKQLEMVGLEIEADTSNIQIKDMAASGINVIAHLYSGVQNQIIQSLDEVILDHLYKMGVTHAANVYESQGINYSLYIGLPTNTQKAFTNVNVEFNDILGEDARGRMGNIPNALVSAAYENQMTHGERLYSRLLVIIEFVSYQNRIAPADFIVVPGELCACLKKQATFSACPVATTLSSNPELHYTGTIFETVNVYKNPRISFNDPRILFGRRGNDTDPGSKFLAYDLAASRQTIAEQTMAEKIRVWSRFAIADIGFYPELNYYTMVALNEYQWV